MGDVAYLPQRENVDWDFPITVRGLVEMGCYLRLSWWRQFSDEDHRNVDAALKAIEARGPGGPPDQRPLRGPAAARFSLRALWRRMRTSFSSTSPFAGLDKQSQETLGETIKEIARKGNLVIASHHDLKKRTRFFRQRHFPERRIDRPRKRQGDFHGGKYLEDFFHLRILGGARMMNWLLEPFHNVFMLRAMLACTLVGFTNGFLSAFIVLRRLALMADALSHAMLPGVAVGIILFGFAPAGLFLGAVTASAARGARSGSHLPQLAREGGDRAGDSFTRWRLRPAW